MEYLTEILKYLAPAALGGGVAHIFNIRASIRRSANQISEADFDTVSKVVKGATADLKALAERIGELEKDRVRILEEMSVIHEEKNKLQDEMIALKKENQRLERALRAHISSNNPNML